MEFIEQFLHLHPYILLAIIGGISFLEGLPIIGTLVAGGTLSIGIGTLASKGLIEIVPAFIVCVLGTFVGDIIGYFVIKKYKNRVKHLERIVKPIEENDTKYSRFFDQNYFLVTILSRLLPVVRSLPSVFAAVRNVNSMWYIIGSLIASIVWALSGILIGYGLGSILSTDFAVGIIIGFVLLPSLVGGIRYMYRKMIT